MNNGNWSMCNFFLLLYAVICNARCFSRANIEEFGITPHPKRHGKGSKVKMELSGWDGHRLTTSIAKILIEDYLGYTVEVVSNPNAWSPYELAGTGGSDVNLEVWPYSKSIQEYNKWIKELGKTVDMGFLGLSGGSGLYIPSYVLTDNPEIYSDFWRSYSGDDTLDLFTKNGAWASGSTDDNLLTGNGREFVPPYCALKTNPPDCKDKLNTEMHWERKCNVTEYDPQCFELLAISSGYDAGIMQQQIRNNNLKITILFLSEDNFYNHVWDHLAKRKPFMFYYWVPSAFILNHDFTRVCFPNPTEGCYKNHNQTLGLKGIGSVNCDFRKQNILKIRRANMDPVKYKDFLSFIRAYSLMNHEQNSLLLRLSEGGFKNGTTKWERATELSCDWLQENPLRWKSWIPEADPVRTVKGLQYTFVYVISIIFLTISLVVFVMLNKFKDHIIIRAGSFPFLMIMVIGSILAYVPLILYPMLDYFEGACNLIYLLFGMAFMLIFGSLFVKSYRIYWLFNHPNPESIKEGGGIPNSRLFQYLTLFLVYELTGNLVWWFVAPSHSIRQPSSTEFVDYKQCDTSNASIYLSILLFPKVMILFANLRFAYATKVLYLQYKESKWIVVSMSNALFMGGIFGFLMNYMAKRGDFEIVYFLMAITTIVLASISVLLILGPKFYMIKNPPKPVDLDALRQENNKKKNKKKKK